MYVQTVHPHNYVSFNKMTLVTMLVPMLTQLVVGGALAIFLNFANEGGPKSEGAALARLFQHNLKK